MKRFMCRSPETTISLPEASQLVTVRDVPMISTGIDYPTSTGPMTFTAEDLSDLIASQDDPAIHPPRTKLGHTDPRFNATVQPDGTVLDGEPSLGSWTNLRLGDNGQTVYGDLEGVPRWFANILATAYPSRSVEGNFEVETVTGHKWRLVVDAVALLGVVGPGCTTLADLPPLFSEEGPGNIQIIEAEEGEPMSVVRSSKPVVAETGDKKPRAVQAQTNVDDVRRSYYEAIEGQPDKFWWWIRAIYMNPNELIVDDDEGGLMRVPFTFNDEGDNITFGEATPVKIQYVDQPKAAASMALRASLVTALGCNRIAATYKVRAESRPDTGGSMTPEQIALLRQRLNLTPEQLPDNATEAQVMAVLAETPDPAPGTDPPPAPAPTPGTEPGTDPAHPDPRPGTPDPGTGPASDPAETDPTQTPPPPGTGGPSIPEGMVLVDGAAWEQVRSQAQEGAAVAVSMRQRERDRILDDAIQAGKFPPARRQHYLDAWNADEEGTRGLIASLSPGLVPVAARGTAGGDSQTAEAYDRRWLTPGERARIEAAAATRTAGNGNGNDRVIQGGD